jgi:FkbM family methyltransferase
MAFLAEASHLGVKLIGWTAAMLAGTSPSWAGHSTVRVLSGPLRGSVLEVPLGERVGMAAGRFNRQLLPTFRRHVPRGGVVYDIGAHVGYLTLVFCELVGADGRVVAFEAASANLDALTRNVVRNRAGSEVVVEGRAVAARSGDVSFATFDYSFVGHIVDEATPDDGSIVSVPAVSIDDFVFTEGNPPPAFVKCTISGRISGVIEGMSATIDAFRPPMILLVENRERFDVLDAMTDRGYVSRPLTAKLRADRDQVGYVLCEPL